MVLDFKKIEEKWQEKWEKSKIFQVSELPRTPAGAKKFYVLEMFPYPSGSGLHMGHAFSYTLGDIFARFKRMQGYNVLHPMGYDSFGLPAENAAVKTGTHPKKYTETSILSFINQQKKLGLSYDWSRILMTHNPDYYKWNQFLFLKLLDKKLVYRKKAPVNWCPKCESVLANEQIHNGNCWVHKDVKVTIKQLDQWFLKTTAYAEELLKDVESLDWPERIKAMQKNWIGKSYGTEIDFEINGKKWPIFTTRSDTIYGVTFMVVSAQHPNLMTLVDTKQKKEVEEFLKRIKSTKQEDLDKLEKEGVFTGSFAVNPLSKEKVPVYVGNFVVADYGSGMVMAVPAHDKRDFEFAKKYKIPIKVVVKPEKEEISNKKNNEESAYTSSGILVNSKEFNDLFSEEAKEHITKALELKKIGRKTVQYKMRDWLVSRQRYWGTPIPVVYCENCGIIPVAENNLPVLLPEKVKFGKGNPLDGNRDFVIAKCPKCGEKGRRETDTMDTFFDSSWYYLRYTDSKNESKTFDKEKMSYWSPVDFYTGGAEHACMHLLYARFFTKALRDLGFLEFDEPFQRLFNQGMVHGSDGFVMSKSRGNVVDPLEMVDKYGADALRLFLMSIASPDKDTQWNENGIEGNFRFVNRLAEHFSKIKIGSSDAKVQSKINLVIKEVTEEIESIKYNAAIIKLKAFFDYINERQISQKDLESFVKILSPFCPHVTEEIWEKMGNSSFISLAKWPEVDERKINENFEKEDKAIDSLVSDTLNIIKIVKEKGKKVSELYLYCIPNEVEMYKGNLDSISRRTGLKANVFAVNDKNKHDPEGKSGKAKPARPAIYIK